MVRYFYETDVAPAPRIRKPDLPAYDYIITGAGSAGCVLANILSAESDVRVLLLEAGERDSSPLIHMPGAVGKLIGGTRFNWSYRTVPQRALNNRCLFLPQGKGLGGSSSINGMIYIRGNRADYDYWRQLGNPGWGYEDVLPYFLAMENNQRLRNEFHGNEGPLFVSDFVSPHPLTDVFIAAAAECGVPRNSDFNGEQQEGTGLFQQTVRRGLRWSATKAFLRPALGRKNLTVLPETLVSRILVEKGRAVGVETVDARGNRTSYRAEREVVVTSGAVGSPKLLLLSGIGPADELREVGVPVKHDLPGVGKNFHDHLDITVIYECTKPITYDGQDALIPSIRHGLQFLLFRTGNVASALCQAAAYVRSDPALDIPDISLHFLPIGFLDHGRIRLSGHNMTFHNNNMRPRSRGEIKLASDDPSKPPLIDPNYASDPYDMNVMVQCVKWIRRLTKTKAMQPYVGGERYPGVEVQSDEEIANYVREHAETDYHPVGGCKMGTDPMAVVDPTLKVHGMEGLRVADSSIMPAIISGNTNAPTIMIATKAADFIRGKSTHAGDWKAGQNREYATA